MARPREFDAEKVLQEAMEAFWEHGYSATSIRDLLGETKLGRGSLYGAFGDKRTLFLAALDEYDRQRVEQVKAILERPGSARSALRDWMDEAVRSCRGIEGRRGCLAAKAAMELAPHDPDVAQWLKRFHKRNEQILAGVIWRGQEQGEIDPRLDSNAAARLLLSCLAGLHVLGATGPTEQEVRDVTEMAMRVLEGPATGKPGAPGVCARGPGKVRA